MVNIVDKDLLDSDAGILIHQTNCMGIMGSGVALALKQRYPEIFPPYKELCAQKGSELLGTCQFVQVDDGKIIANLFGQNKINRNWYLGGETATDLSAVEQALKEVVDYAQNHGVAKIALPYKMGAVRGGARWEDVLKIIEKVCRDVETEICRI